MSTSSDTSASSISSIKQLDASIHSTLRTFFHLNDVSLHRLPSSHRSIRWIAEENSRRYFVKMVTVPIKLHQIQAEIFVCDYLLNHDMNVCRFVRPSNNHIPNIDGHYVTVQEFIDGITPDNHSASEALEIQTAQLLGRINTLLASLKLPASVFSPNWPTATDIKRAYDSFTSIRKSASSLTCSDDQYKYAIETIIEDCRIRLSYIASYARQAFRFDTMTSIPSHGDYSIRQMIIDPANAIHLVDWTSVRLCPPAWELIRSFTIADSTANTGNLNGQRLRRYLQAYLSEHELSKADIYGMIPLYATQLLLNPYGYEEQFDQQLSPSERQELLAFGHWRTQLLAELFTNGLALYETYLSDLV